MTEEQGERVIELLALIAAQLDAYAALGAASESGECLHPDDQRVSLSTPGDPNHWVCTACRFDNKAVTVLS